MQAVIIAGGKGTRLLPLTYGSPKPMLPLLERPFLRWMVDRCQQAGITDILMNIRYHADQIQAYFGDGSDFGVQIRYVIERTALDTAGAMKLAEPFYTGEPLVVFNADILTDLDLKALMAAHEQTQAQATLALARVADPTAFGLVELSQADGTLASESLAVQPIHAFREKPSAAEAAQLGIDTINAGTYVLNPSIFEQYPVDQPLSFERTVFPELLAQQQRMTGMVWEGYWMDLGTPAKYYQGNLDILTGAMPYPLEQIATEQHPGVWVMPSATVDDQAQLEGPCFIGDRVYLGPLAQIPAGAIVGANSWLNRPLAPGIYAPGTLAV
jgi:mannose-1-phosphate guanylyltransferase/mannose-1-phosphate guanylyltransferase/phosphomannomutase